MKYSNTVEYNISTKLDASGLTKLQSQIKQVELSLQRMGDKEFLNSDRVSEARKQLEGLNTSLTRSFNSSLGILDLSKLQTELQTAGVDAKGLGTAFNMAGSQGQAALNSLITQIGNFNGGIERTSSQIDKIFTTFSNTFRWGLVSSFFSQFMNAIHSSIDYVKELDDSLTQIMLVTDYNRDSMNEYAKSANEAAKALSMSTTGMTNASLVFAQQGYDLNQSQELATLSAKLANASQQDTAITSDQITAYMNAYGLENSIGELTQAMDNWALIANISAADVGELAQASQRAASMANTVGVSGEQLAAQIATIESVTREAPEQIGNGLKTLYARFSDISAGGEDEDGVSLGDVTKQLNDIGVQVLDQFGNIRDVGDIMEDLMVVWDDLDETSKIAAAQSLAGKYQVNRFVSLMDNSDMYREYLGATGSSAAGTLDQMNQEYAESLVGRTQKLNTTLEGLFNDVFTTDTVYPLIDALTKLADGIDTVFKSIGNGPTILLTLASAFGQLFSTNIARSVNNMISNQQLQEVRKNNIANVGNVLDQLGLGDSEISQYIKTMAENAPKMNQEQYDQYMAALQDWSNTTTQLAAKEEELQGTLDVLNMVYGTKLKTPSAINKDDETGKINFTIAEEARANLSNKQLTALASKEDFVEETQQIMSLSKELGKAQTAYENFKLGTIDADEALRRFDLASDQVGQQLESLRNAGILSEASFDQLNETFKQVTNGLITGTDDIDQLEQELDELIRRFFNLGEAASSMDPNTFKRWILSGIEQAKKQEQELQGLKIQDEQNKDAATGQIENIVSQNAIEGVIKVTSSLGELAGAIITVQNLGQILTNDDLVPTEKFVQILTGIGVLIPTVLTSIKNMSDGIKALKEAQLLENTVLAAQHVLEITSLKIKQQNIIKNIENATSMKTEMVAAAELAGVNTALATAETAAGAAATQLAGGLASVWAALGPIGIAIIGLTAVLGGSALKYLWDEAKEAETQQKALNELTDQTAETASKLNETTPALNELYDAYKQTGEASDEFKQSLESQAELLGINDAALLISQGKYEDLKAKIDEATEAIYNSNAALQQAKLDKINPNEMVNELTDDQKERYNVTYHQEEGITGITGGTATKGQVSKLDQTPYELIKAAQQDIETQQEKINSLTQERNNLVKEGLTATGEASQKIAEDITKVDEELTIAAQKLAESKEFTENHSDILEAINAIRDNALDQELNSPDSIFKTGTYEEIKDFISAQEGVDSSNIDELIAKYAELAENATVAAEAAKKLKENVEGSSNTPLILPENNYRSDEEQKNIQEDLNLSDEEYKGYQNALVDDNKHLQTLSEEAEYLEENSEALQKHREELEEETKTLQEDKEALEKKAEKLNKNTKQYADIQEKLEDYNKQITKNQKELKKEVKNSEDVQDQLEDLENKIIETAVGAKELGEVWEDNSKILRDGDSDWAQQAEAINNLAPGLAHLLNMDLSEIQALPQSFWESTQNLNDMEAAINGDVEALQRLRGETTKELLVKAGVDPSSDLYGEMVELIDMANQVLPWLEAGATINDDQFIAKLNEMIATTIAAGGDIEAVLAAYERLGLQFTQTGTTQMRVPRVRMSTKLDNTDMAQEAAISTYTANPIVEWETVDVPTYDYKRTSGGPGFTGGYSPSSTGGRGGSCFVAGTLVTTLTGFSPIEQIKQGDIVLSYNELLHQLEYSTVVQTMTHNVIEPIYTLHIKDEQLRVTGVHRFLISRDIFHSTSQWIPAADLQIGDWMFLADGTWHLIHNIEVNIEHQIVYNFEVAGNHNYYVGRSQILAHNKGGKSCFVAGTLISTSLGFKPIEQIQKGNIVLSYNEQIHHNQYSTVLQTMIHDTIEPIYTLYIKDEQLRVTSIHRFLVIDKITCGAPQWIHAADLHVGQWVLFADGTWHVIHKIEVNIEHQTVYNFEVSGNHNYYVGRNQILAHNKGGKGGGGGGGKAKTIEPKEKEEHEKDYYEEVNSQLDKTEKILSGIEKEEDRLIGDKARANQNKQLKLLQREIDLQTKKLKILTEQEKKDVTAALQKSDKEAEKILQKYAMITLPNPEFDEDGMIANYEKMSAAIDAAHNRLIEEYNKAAAAGNEERTKEIQKEIDKFDKLGESILKNAKRSNEIQTEIEEINNTIEELNDSIEDIRIDAYKASQEALDNLKDIKESAAELNKLFRDFDDSSFGMNRWSIDDTPYGDLIENLSKLDEMYGITAESAGNFYDELIAQKKAALAATTDADEQDAISRAIQFFEEQKAQLSDTDSLSNGLLGLSQQDLARLQEWMDNPGAANNPFGENTSALFDAYQDAYERTLSLFKDYRETIQDTRDTILDIYDETEESIERQMDQYDRLIEKVERISDTYTLYYGEDSYDQLDQFYARQGDIMQSQLDKLTDAYNYWQDQYEKAVAIGDEKLIQEVQDRMDDAEDAMLDAAQGLAELWVEKFENAVEASSQHIYKDLFGTGDIEELTDNWELQKDYMERYRDDVEKAYEVDKLRNKYLDLLDTAQGSSVQTQNRIRQQMQEQLDLLQNQATVSEYDVKLANAKLEILQKQIALEDAQRNKNKMQLRRDTQGNYRYVYTADQGDVRQAQQNLEDSEYDAYEMTKQETLANNDRAINMLQDYIQKRAAIWNKYKDDSAARAEALANLESEYSKIFDALREDFSDTSEGMIDVLNWLVQNGTENTTNAAIDMLHTLYDENGKVKDKTGQDWMDMATLIQDQVLPEIEDSVTKANLEMEKHAEDLKESMTGTDGALTKIGSGASDVENSMTKAADATNKLATATKALFAALGADKGELQAALDKLVDYEKQLHSTQQTTSQLSTQLGQANKTIAAKNAEAQNYRTILDLKSGVKDFKKGEEYTIKKGTWVWYDRDGAFQMDSEGAKGFAVPEDVKVKIMTDYLTMGDRQAYYPVTIYPTDQAKWGKHLADFEGEEGKRTRRQQDWHIGIETFRNALKYDTGGYTGDWKDQTQDAKNGKLALLHQKELVLNATDTENILAAVNIVREVAKAVKISAGYVSALNTNAYPLNNKDTIQQRVEISATFPNATDADDIRNALIGLSDKAYQYAHRTI